MFAKFHKDGNPVMVNLDNVTFTMPADDGKTTLFFENSNIVVDEPHQRTELMIEIVVNGQQQL